MAHSTPSTDEVRLLVTVSIPQEHFIDPEKLSNQVATRLYSDTDITYSGMVERTITVVPLPDLGANDSDLQTGFRALSSALRYWDRMNTVAGFSAPIPLSHGQLAALVAELSKQDPQRTGDVDRAALDAALEIRKHVADKRLHPTQRIARIQLAIIDAICRCLPEEKA